MDDKGFAFTPLTFLLLVPVMILAISYNGIINDVNAISAIAIGGDVTITVANNIISVIDEDTGDAGRNSALNAVQTVINNTSIKSGNQPFFPQTGSNTSTNNITSSTAGMISGNITNTCIALENQTGRTIYVNNIPVDNSTSSSSIKNSLNLTISQSDPYGFYINVNKINITVVQNGSQNVTFNTPARNVYVSIINLEDPYIWVNTHERNSSVIYSYPYYTNGNSSGASDYHFADNQSSGRLDYLWQCFNGPNASLMGPSSYYFPDPHGLSFFDRLENKTNYSSTSPTSARMASPTSADSDCVITPAGDWAGTTLRHARWMASGSRSAAMPCNGSRVR